MRLLSLVVTGTVLSIGLAARADTINFSLTGQQGTASFSLVNPVPTSQNPSQFTYHFSTLTINGQVLTGDVVTFDTAGFGGGFSLGDNADTEGFSETGPQVFSGTTAAPIFQSQSFLLSGTFGSLNGSVSGSETLTITVVPSAVTPEPSGLVLLGTGLLGVVGAVRRREGAKAKANYGDSELSSE